MNLFDHAEAQRQRDEAIAQGEAHADPVWKDLALFAIKSVCTTQMDFTTDDVHQVLNELAVEATHDTRALGSVMQRAQRLGYCVPTDMVRNSSRAVCHAGPKRVWESQLCE